MKPILIVLLFIAQLTHAQRTEIRTLESFDGLRVGYGIDVKLVKGDKPSARIEATGINLNDVTTEVQGSTLRIGLRDIRLSARNNVKVELTFRELERITAGTAASVYAKDPIRAEAVELTASGAGSIELTVEADRLLAEASTAGSMILAGKAVKFTVVASTSSTIDAYQLEAAQVKAEVSTASDARLNVTREIEAEASTAGSIRYKGNPERSNCTSTTAGVVRHMN